jgi:hypothetical protein
MNRFSETGACDLGTNWPRAMSTIITNAESFQIQSTVSRPVEYGRSSVPAQIIILKIFTHNRELACDACCRSGYELFLRRDSVRGKIHGEQEDILLGR